MFVCVFIYFLVDDQTIESKDIARSVLSALHAVMRKVQSCPSYQGVRYEFGLKCDLCLEEKTPCLRHEKEACSNDDCVCILNLECLNKEFAVCPRNRTGKISSKLHEKFWVNVTGKKNVLFHRVKKLCDEVKRLDELKRNLWKCTLKNLSNLLRISWVSLSSKTCLISFVSVVKP